MKLKKVISMVLASAMVVGMLAGCGNTSTADPTKAPSATQAPAATKAPAADPTATPVPTAAPAKIEEKTISAAAKSLLETAQKDFGGTLYLKALDGAYKRMLSGSYSSTSTATAAKVGDKTKNVTLNMSVLYNALRMSYTLDKAYEAADGNTYKKGDLLPTWKQFQENLGFTINDVTSTESSVNNNYKVAKAANFENIDVICGSAASFNEDGQTGSFIPLDLYLDYMPNFKAFLEENEVVKTIITAGDGHIYFAPYFDGYNDIEKTFLVRIDWVKALLNGNYDASKFDGAYSGQMTYTNYMPDSATGSEAIEVSVVKADGSGVEKVTKSYEKNITNILKDLSDKTGASMVKALRDYIDTTYNGYYGENRADLFIGQNAAYDADEFIALIRCVVANPKYLTNGASDVVYGLFGREATLQRTSDLITLCSNLFGVRGADSEKDYLYFDANGNLCDGRQSSDMYYVIEKMNQMYTDGLILTDFDKEGAGGASGTKVYDTMYNKNLGFGLYDYVQVQTAYNNTVSVEGFDLESIINPVAYWYTTADSEGNLIGKWTRFTESWRSVKTEGWAITTGCAADADKLAKALYLFDYMYSTEGNTLMSYGPDAWIEHDSKGNIVYIDYQGTQVPKLSAAALNELKTLAKGSYTNYYRQYLAATFPIGYIKQQGMEYQCTSDNGKKGLEKINNALVYGVLEHVQVNSEDCESPFYRIIPTTFATTSSENSIISDNCTNLSSYFSKTKKEYSIFIESVKVGFEKAVSAKNAQ